VYHYQTRTHIYSQAGKLLLGELTVNKWIFVVERSIDFVLYSR